MKSIIILFIFAALVTGCDEVSEKAASKAGKVLKKYQDQNKD